MMSLAIERGVAIATLNRPAVDAIDEERIVRPGQAPDKIEAAALDPSGDGFEVDLAKTAMRIACGGTRGLVRQFIELHR